MVNFKLKFLVWIDLFYSSSKNILIGEKNITHINTVSSEQIIYIVSDIHKDSVTHIAHKERIIYNQYDDKLYNKLVKKIEDINFVTVESLKKLTPYEQITLTSLVQQIDLQKNIINEESLQLINDEIKVIYMIKLYNIFLMIYLKPKMGLMKRVVKFFIYCHIQNNVLLK